MKVAVVNGTGIRGLAGRVAGELNALGYVTVAKNTSNLDMQVSVIYFRSGYGADAAAIADALNAPSHIRAPAPATVLTLIADPDIPGDLADFDIYLFYGTDKVIPMFEEEPMFEEPMFEEPMFEEPMFEEPMFEEPIFEEPMFEEEPMAIHMDTNGDGEITLGVATAGQRYDAYYEVLVNAAIEISKANGWADPVTIDSVHSAVAFNEFENLVAKGVDVVAIDTMGELSDDAVLAIVEKYPDVFWYCNCGAGYPQTPGVALSRYDEGQIQYVAGYAAGLLLKERGGDAVAMLGCCDLGFEVETELAFRLGLRDVDPSYDVIYTPTGNFR